MAAARKIMYYTLLWLRPIFLLLSRWVQYFFTGAFLFMLGMNLLTASHTEWWAIAVWGLLAFGIFWLRQSYDSLLLKLNPTGHTLILYK